MATNWILRKVNKHNLTQIAREHLKPTEGGSVYDIFLQDKHALIIGNQNQVLSHRTT